MRKIFALFCLLSVALFPLLGRATTRTSDAFIWDTPADKNCTPGTDNKASFDTAISAVTASATGVRTLYVPKGCYLFASAPSALINNGSIKIVGAGISNGTTFLYNGPPWLGFFTINTNQVTLENFAILVGSAATGSTAIYIAPSGANIPDGFVLNNLWISYSSGTGLPAGGTWNNGIFVNGQPRNPMGVRDWYMDRLNIFATTGSSIWLQDVVGGHISNAAMFPVPPGIGTVASIIVTTDPGYLGGNLYFSNTQIAGQLNITNTSHGTFMGEITGLNTDCTSSFWFITGIDNTHTESYCLANSTVMLQRP